MTNGLASYNSTDIRSLTPFFHPMEQWQVLDVRQDISNLPRHESRNVANEKATIRPDDCRLIVEGDSAGLVKLKRFLTEPLVGWAAENSQNNCDRHTTPISTIRHGF